MRANRVENAVHHFDMAQGDDDVDVTMTASTGVQAEAQTDSTGVQAKAQTTSSGSQSKTRMGEFGGTQTTISLKRIKVIKLLKIDLKK